MTKHLRIQWKDVSKGGHESVMKRKYGLTATLCFKHALVKCSNMQCNDQEARKRDKRFLSINIQENKLRGENNLRMEENELDTMIK